MSATEKKFEEMARKGRWGDAARFARLLEFLVIEGRVQDFLAFVAAEDQDLDAYLTRTEPDACERAVLRYLEESGAPLAGLQAEAEENPVCDSRDHF
jgi:hypothetical protein